MKKKCLIGIRIVSFLLLCVCIMWYLSNILTVREFNSYPKRNEFWQTMNAEDDNTIDLMFVGDSSFIHSVVPMQIWKDSHITSFLMSYSVMKPQEAYFDLKKLFKTQSPKYVFIESQFLVGMNDNDYDYYKKEVENSVDYLDSEIYEGINCYLPVMKYKREWRGLHLSDFVRKHPEKINSIFKGYKYDATVKPFKGKHPQKSKGYVKFKNSGDIYFDKIYKLCKENNCKVSLMTMPQGKGWNKQKHNKIVELANKYNVDYLDFDVSLKKYIKDFSWKTDTKDGGLHLNYSGAKKVTRELNKYLTKNLAIKPTKLENKDVKHWNHDMKDFYSCVK